MGKFEEGVKKNDGYFVGGKVGIRNKCNVWWKFLCVNSMNSS
jgi:hypothetical protein